MLFRSKWKYPALSFKENFLGGHVRIGRLVIYGENAMHWSVEIATMNGYWVFRLPFKCYGSWWSLFCYWSPNGTPSNAAIWLWGKKQRGYA